MHANVYDERCKFIFLNNFFVINDFLLSGAIITLEYIGAIECLLNSNVDPPTTKPHINLQRAIADGASVDSITRLGAVRIVDARTSKTDKAFVRCFLVFFSYSKIYITCFRTISNHWRLLTLPTKIMTARNIRRGMLWWKM
jgi:hypothetical protein